MLEICTHNFLFFKRKEFWFYDNERIKRGAYNVFCYTQEKNLTLKKDVLCEKSSLIDLQITEEELFANINSTFSYHIKKAQKIGVITLVKFSPTKKECEIFMEEFSAFANRKNIEWSKNRIFALQKLNRLIISDAYLNNQKIGTHIYLHDTERVVLLHSYHLESTMDVKIKGYSNKYLHWQDIISFKKRGFITYDFGGINFEKHAGITQFKLSFGGNIVHCFSYIEVNPLLNAVMKLYKRLR